VRRIAKFYLKFLTGTRKNPVRLRFGIQLQINQNGAAQTVTVESNSSRPFIVITNECQWEESEGILLKKDAFGEQVPLLLLLLYRTHAHDTTRTRHSHHLWLAVVVAGGGGGAGRGDVAAVCECAAEALPAGHAAGPHPAHATAVQSRLRVPQPDLLRYAPHPPYHLVCRVSCVVSCACLI
jgi:hypothetical protein